MRDAGDPLLACANALRTEADRWDAAASGLHADVGIGLAADELEAAQEELGRDARDLARLRRAVADQLQVAGHALSSLPPTHARTPLQEEVAHRTLAQAARALSALDRPRALHTSRRATLPLVGAAASLLWTPAALFLGWRLGTEVFAPSPTVQRLRPGGPEGSDAAQARLDAARPRDVADLISACALVDAMGRDQRAVVDVARVTPASGDEVWILTLPSTQDWVVPHGDAPAPNDLDAILDLALMPQVASAYREGVEEAVRQAGIPAGAPVLVVGFSLGGMLAADLARSGLGNVSVEALVVAGSPIDTADDPPGMPVLSLVHDGDTVPAMDLAPEGDGPLRITVTDSVPPGAQAHSATTYAATAQAHDGDGSLSAPFARFLATDESTQVVHQQFQIVEASRE
ncbi:hypothetical protein [Demequina capsici]|uniref:Alpha/beta hydrolase family protein n=1 Tax=Demequina capsici TaxID=3075620 RepID=A0AA96JAB2_9MICO|nr:hypothetical protein [Demequina sp. OYTSA14]WNM24466.1 hypothetical protein RN606_14040 [Demequina sp. OYTSA14]